MRDKVFSKEEWNQALHGLKESYRVFVPVKEGDMHVFRALTEGKKPDFGFQNSRHSPKGLIYPQSERMFDYDLDESKPDANMYKEAAKDYCAQAVVGVRPCDAHALEIVRKNFDAPPYRDPWWVRKMECTTFIGLGCNDPCPTCFCTSVGGGPFSEKGLDAILFDLGEMLLVRTLTPKGEVFVAKMAGGKDATPELVKEAEVLAASSSGKVSSHVPTDQLKGKVLNELFHAPFWEEVAFACINCGTCTYLCPTCWCFDIQDEVLGKAGDRMRNWDSCMFPLFTLHGSGHNPRDKKHQRVRQRFMHKLKYYVDRYGDGVQCSGCGRCVKYCPVNIDIRSVIGLMNSY